MMTHFSSRYPEKTNLAVIFPAVQVLFSGSTKSRYIDVLKKQYSIFLVTNVCNHVRWDTSEIIGSKKEIITKIVILLILISVSLFCSYDTIMQRTFF